MKPCWNSPYSQTERRHPDVRMYPAQYTWPQTPFPVTEEWTKAWKLPPTPITQSNLKPAKWNKYTLIQIIYVQFAPRDTRCEREKKELYGGWIIVTVVVISAAATLITIRFDFIWECLHSCSPLTPLTPFSLLPLLPHPPTPLPLD